MWGATDQARLPLRSPQGGHVARNRPWHGGDGFVKRFDDSRDRVLAAIAAVEAAERECLRAVTGQVAALAEEAGLAAGQLLVFHAAPRDETVWALDDRDCSLQDAVLQAVDLADVRGQRLRLTRSGLTPLRGEATLSAPQGSFAPCPHCFHRGSSGRPSPGPSPVQRVPPPPVQRVPPPPMSPRVGDRFWQRAVLTWVDLHRALATWTGRWLAASLIVAPETGDVASLEPLYCPDRGQDFEVVTSLRLAAQAAALGDLDTALVTVLEAHTGLTPDHVEFDLRRWLYGSGFVLPGFPAHAPGECES